MRCSALLLAALVFAACGSPRASNSAADEDTPISWTAESRDLLPPPPPPLPRTAFVNSSNAFAANLWGVVRNKPGNLAVSPANISIALAMTFVGARGETAEEMRRVLHFNSNPAEAVRSAGEVLQGWNASNGPVLIRWSNRLFGQQTYAYEKSFLDTTEQTFGAPTELVDFTNNPERTRQRINIWMARATEYRISESIPSGGIDSDTRLVLVNAIYFKADWLQPFDAAYTERLPFHVTNTEKRDVPMMNGYDTLRFADRDGVRALELYYKGKSASMMFLLPDKIEGLTALEQSLTSEEMDRWVDVMKPVDLEVTLPKFNIEPSSPISLRSTLQTLGMRLAFDQANADFAGIATPKGLTDRPYIQNVFHNAFVSVDEKGTESGAGTVILSGAGGRLPVFRADHPFLFVLRDRKTGMILFMGRVADPSTR